MKIENDIETETEMEKNYDRVRARDKEETGIKGFSHRTSIKNIKKPY